MSVFNLLYRNSFELSSKFDIFSSIFSSYFSFIVFLNVFLNVSLTSKKGLLKSSKLFFIKIYFFKYFCGKGVPCINIFITYIFIYIKCFLNKGVYSIRLNPGIVEHILSFYK